jgi:type III pantothenate kinase
MILTIDHGNTRIKLAVFEHTTLIEAFVCGIEQFDQNLKIIFKKYDHIYTMVVSSVGKDLEYINLEDFPEIEIIYISHKSRFPYNNLYKTPQTLGIDRMVLAAGAAILYPDKNKLIIDAGTCITYDYINHKNQYAGGAISPGLRLRYKALHNFTSKLPSLKTTSPENSIGNSTAESIHSGVVNGLTKEIDGIINDFIFENQNFIIILTGGDTVFLANRLKNTIFANSNFLLESLNLLYIYNSNND